jgi:hypothetical protein
MLELTPEMEQAFRDAWMTSMATDPRSDDPERIADRAGLTAVLALIEREYAIGPRGCCEPAPGEPMAYCELAEGHRGKHSATVEKAVDW